MRGLPEAEARTTIEGVVEDLLQRRGYDGVQLRDVAERSHVSLARIYKLYGSREELIVAAVHGWMARNGYAGLTPPLPTRDVRSGLLHVLRSVFEPWEREPRMLEAFHRARTGKGGGLLIAQGFEVIGPALQWVLRKTKPDYAADVEVLLLNLFYAVFGRFADGELPIDEVLPTLERAVLRLT